MREDMQDALNTLYQSLKTNPFADPDYELYDHLRGPDLAWASPAYIAAKPRVILVGQQQDGWSYSYREFVNEWTIERAVGEYRDFNFGATYNRSPFWQFHVELRRGIFGDHADRGVVGWLNLVKFVTEDRERVIGTPFEDRALALQDHIFVGEVQTMKPDVCVFTTGPNYDHVIDRYFPGVEFQPTDLGVRTLAVVKHRDLPERSFRTYHPKPLRLSKQWHLVLERVISAATR
jgi:hypothetical protein